MVCSIILCPFIAAYLPLDVTFPENRINHILNEAKPVIVSQLSQ